MMIIGLYSGRELIVQDRSYFVQVGETLKQVFITEDGTRRYIVDEKRIEFYDEVNTQEYLDKIHQSIKETSERNKNHKTGVDYV